MKLVQLELNQNENLFWFLGNIKLSNDFPFTDLIDVDQFSEEEKETIDKSIKSLNIKAFDKDGNRIFALDNLILSDGAFDIDVEDVDIPENEIPNIVSVTDDNDEEEIIVYTDKDIEEAQILLSKNGNTVKKTILAMVTNEDVLSLLLAIYYLETNGKNRKSIIVSLEEKINDCYKEKN